MKLELKHIVGYLHYGLKCKILNWKNDYIGEEYGIIDGYYFCAEEPHFYLNNGKSRGNAGKSFDNIKPILRPLSDLTKEIEVNGEKFIPAIKLGFMKCDVDFILNNKIDLIQFRFIKKLYEWYFDIYGLIENGLAIDINKV